MEIPQIPRIPKDVLRNCVGLGLLACRLPSMRQASLDVFEAVRVVEPDSAAWIIGTAMVYANADDDAEKACRFMTQQGVSAGSGDLLARAFLALFLVMADRSREAEGVSNAVLAEDGDADASRLARSLLDNEILRR